MTSMIGSLSPDLKIKIQTLFQIFEKKKKKEKEKKELELTHIKNGKFILLLNVLIHNTYIWFININANIECKDRITHDTLP